LHHVFTEIYHYGVQLYEIPNAKPDKTLKRRLYDFLQQEEESMSTMLFIVYMGDTRERACRPMKPLFGLR
jgi:hypothetical protein